MSVHPKIVFVLLAILIALIVNPATAQDATPEATATAAATPDVAVQRIEIQAADGLTLVGDLYNAQLNVQTPALLLMHMFQGNRHDSRSGTNFPVQVATCTGCMARDRTEMQRFSPS